MNAAAGIVVIGRNEGARLARCLDSLRGAGAAVVYVDSGSRDGSPALARASGAEVVCLDPSRAFTAARARNEGYARLRQLLPGLAYVQFIDGDCEMDGTWLGAALRFLESQPTVAVACGRRRERFPHRSVYNLLCDMEWDTPLGETQACGGDALVRAVAFEQAGRFRAHLIAGEEPELCMRLRALGWRVWRLDREMTRHDAAMSRFGQYWTRAVRAGHAFAEVARLGAARRQRQWLRESRSPWWWGIGVPLLAGAAGAAFGPAGLLLLLAYPVQVARIALRGRRAPRENWTQALFLVVGKFAELQGQCSFLVRRALRTEARLIEYK